MTMTMIILIRYGEVELFYGVLGVVAVVYVHFVWDVVTRLASHLGIQCFTIPLHKQQQAARK